MHTLHLTAYSASNCISPLNAILELVRVCWHGCSGSDTQVRGGDLDVNDDERVFARFPRVVAERLSYTLHIIFYGVIHITHYFLWPGDSTPKKRKLRTKSSLFWGGALLALQWLHKKKKGPAYTLLFLWTTLIH
jgi:hypothetical protein